MHLINICYLFNCHTFYFRNKQQRFYFFKHFKSTTLDLIALQEKEPELYEDLLKDYAKVTNKKGYFKYTFK